MVTDGTARYLCGMFTRSEKTVWYMIWLPATVAWIWFFWVPYGGDVWDAIVSVFTG